MLRRCRIVHSVVDIPAAGVEHTLHRGLRVGDDVLEACNYLLIFVVL